MQVNFSLIFQNGHLTFWERCIDDINVFDAVQFKHVQEFGWQHEQNHAFNPLFPWLFSNTALTAFIQQALLSFSNMLLIYWISRRICKSDQTAEIAAYFYILSHSTFYQISFYSENTFVFFSLCGFFMLSGKQQCHKIVIAAFFFGLATLTRSTGALLSVYIAYPMVSKIVKTPNCFKIFKYLISSWICALFILTPILIVQIIKPYQLHCDSKIDRTDAVPSWCLDQYPNVYSYVQFTYWDNRLFSMMYRSLDKTLVSIPMFIIFIYILFRFIGNQTKSILTFGLIKGTYQGFWGLDILVPHVIFFTLNMLLVMLFANADINSRVASTCPIYFWTAAAIIQEQQKGLYTMSNFIKLHNIAYLLLNCVLFLMEVGFPPLIRLNNSNQDKCKCKNDQINNYLVCPWETKLKYKQQQSTYNKQLKIINIHSWQHSCKSLHKPRVRMEQLKKLLKNQFRLKIQMYLLQEVVLELQGYQLMRIGHSGQHSFYKVTQLQQLTKELHLEVAIQDFTALIQIPQLAILQNQVTEKQRIKAKRSR